MILTQALCRDCIRPLYQDSVFETSRGQCLECWREQMADSIEKYNRIAVCIFCNYSRQLHLTIDEEGRPIVTNERLDKLPPCPTCDAALDVFAAPGD